MTDSKKLREIDLETKGSSALYGLWSVGFLSAFMNIAIIMSSGKVNNVIGLQNCQNFKKVVDLFGKISIFSPQGMGIPLWDCSDYRVFEIILNDTKLTTIIWGLQIQNLFFYFGVGVTRRVGVLPA